ncbi:unnamed protein product [Closterium sp. NIES-54]
MPPARSLLRPRPHSPSPHAARSTQQRALPVATRSQEPRAARHHAQPRPAHSTSPRAALSRTQPAATRALLVCLPELECGKLLPSTLRMLPAAYCLCLSLWSTACCLLSTACCLCLCLRPTVYCPLSAACFLLPLLAAVMTMPNVLAFEPDGRPIDFAVWLDDLQLFLLTDAKEGVSLFDYVSGTAIAPAADAPALERSQW